VAQLQKDADTATKLSAVNKDQVEAIAQVLRTQNETEEHKSFWSIRRSLFFTCFWAS
jgi:hypothetical protein